MENVCLLGDKNCTPCEGGVEPLTEAQINDMLQGLNKWKFNAGVICKTFIFKNHHDVMAFVNAIAWISHRENHHPDTHLAYNQCTVTYKTHAIDGISENDGICAAKIDRLFSL